MAEVSTLLFPWDDSFSVKIGLIDMQHKKMVGMINELHRAMVGGKGKKNLSSILSGLIDYTREHFITEEILMQAHAYPEFLTHKLEHQKLTKTVVGLQRRFRSNEAGLTIEVMEFLKDWLRNHILGSDKRYAPYLNAKGVL